MASKAVATAESSVHPVEYSPSSIDRYDSTDSIAFTFDPFPTEPYSLLFLFFLSSLYFLPFYLFFLPDAHWFLQLNCWIHNSILLAGSVGVSKMAKGSRGRYRIASRQYRPTPYPLARCKRDICEEMCQKKCSKALDKKECEDVTCSMCMEYPHNAVLLLCSSHDKGCRPYMCGTSLRHSNCLDQYKKAYTKVISARNGQNVLGNPFVRHDLNLTDEKNEVTELACPLCRGQVKGWTVVEPVRDYLNEKERSCMQEDCSFVGSYKELKKHVRAEHPLARPRTVDPDDEQKWRWLEWEREREDVISTVTSAMPGAVVFGDYVIEGRHNNDFDSDDEEGALEAGNGDRNGRFQMGMEAMNFFLLLHAVRQGNDLNSISRRLRPELAGLAPNRLADQNEDNELDVILDVSDDDNDDGSYNEGNDDGVSLVSRLRRQGGGRVLLNRSGRRRRRREAHATMEGS